MHEELAEREGFEPSVPTRSTQDFQSCAFDHSATSPENRDILCQTPSAHASEKCFGPARGLPGGGTGRDNHKGHNGHKGGRGRGPRRTGWTTGGNRRSRGLGRIWRSATADRTARRGGRSQRARRETRRNTKNDGDDGEQSQRAQSAGGEGGRERSAGEARRATGGARKPPAQPCVFAVKSPAGLAHTFGVFAVPLDGAPGGVRTPDPRLRRPLLCPAELQARVGREGAVRSRALGGRARWRGCPRSSSLRRRRGGRRGSRRRRRCGSRSRASSRPRSSSGGGSRG